MVGEGGGGGEGFGGGGDGVGGYQGVVAGSVGGLFVGDPVVCEGWGGACCGVGREGGFEEGEGKGRGRGWG